MSTDEKIEVHLRSINKKHYDELNNLRKQRKYSWQELFEHLYNYRNGMVTLLNRGLEPDLCIIKSQQTITASLPLWCDNIAHNMQDILNTGDISYLICKTRKDNKCWKMDKLKELSSDKKEYELSEVSTICQIPIQQINMYLKHARHDICVACTGSDICSTCSNYIRANKPALIIAGGPSLETYKHLDLLKKYGFNGDIFVVSKVLKDVLNHEIMPTYMGALDAAPEDTSFFEYDIVDKYADDITAVFAINIHPTTVKRWKGNKKYYFSGYLSEADMPNLSHAFHLLTHTSQLSVSGNIGSCLYNLASFLGYNPIVMIGMDLSFPTYKTMLEYHPLYTEEDLKTKVKIGKKEVSQYHRRYNPVYKKQYYVDSVFESYVMSHKSWVDVLATYYGTKTINCTEQGALYGENILNLRFEEYLKNQDKYNKNEIIDKDKILPSYTQKDCHEVWQNIVNSHKSLSNPNIYLHKPKDIIELIEGFWIPHITKKDSIFELGCNCGVNLHWLSTMGYNDLSGIDINKKALHKLKTEFPHIYKNGNFYIGSIEDRLPKFKDNEYDIILSMATLQHIHPSQDAILFPELVRIAKKYIITIENESIDYGYSFARNYKEVFEGLKCKEIKSMYISKESHPELNINYHGYTIRLFETKGENNEN